jgi:O-antigen/teichoic acid export membrane protein
MFLLLYTYVINFWGLLVDGGYPGIYQKKVTHSSKKKYVYKKREVLKTSLIPIVGLYILSTLDFLIDLDFFVQRHQVGLQFLYQ